MTLTLAQLARPLVASLTQPASTRRPPGPAPRSRRCSPTGSPARPRSDFSRPAPSPRREPVPGSHRRHRGRRAGSTSWAPSGSRARSTQITSGPDASTVFMCCVTRPPTCRCRDLFAATGSNAPVKLTEGIQVVMSASPSSSPGAAHSRLRRHRDSRGWRWRAAGPHRTAAPAAGRRGALRPADSSGRSRSCPHIGLITGRAIAAERDVMTVAAARWPAVRFEVRNTAVQGPNAVPQIVEALRDSTATRGST